MIQFNDKEQRTKNKKQRTRTGAIATKNKEKKKDRGARATKNGEKKKEKYDQEVCVQPATFGSQWISLYHIVLINKLPIVPKYPHQDHFESK